MKRLAIVAVVLAVMAVLGRAHIPAGHVLYAAAAAEAGVFAVLCGCIRRAARWRMGRLA